MNPKIKHNSIHIDNYLWSQLLPDIDNKKLRNGCILMEKILQDRIKQPSSTWNTIYDTFTGREFQQYNIFTFPSVELMKLFQGMVTTISPYLEQGESYMIQSWLNIFRTNGYIDWHGHWEPQYRTIHGFYCVNTEDTPSYTEYRFKHKNSDIIRVDSQDGLLVFGKSENDIHRSSPGWSSDNPRITIAFDIVPTTCVTKMFKSEQDFIRRFNINHYVPFKT